MAITPPITFTPTPTATDPPPDRANMPLHDDTVAATTLANFEKVNTAIRGWTTPTMAQSVCGVMPTTPVTPNVWTDFSAAFWPSITITIPPGCGALMVGLGGRIKCLTNDPAQQFLITLGISGSGTTVSANRNYHRLCIAYGEQASSLSYIVPVASLVIGGTVTARAQYYRGTSGDMTVAGIDGGNLWMVALR